MNARLVYKENLRLNGQKTMQKSMEVGVAVGEGVIVKEAGTIGLIEQSMQ